MNVILQYDTQLERKNYSLRTSSTVKFLIADGILQGVQMKEKNGSQGKEWAKQGWAT